MARSQPGYARLTRLGISERHFPGGLRRHQPADIRVKSVPEERSGRRRWRPVEPELTHFHDIISFDFDIATDRGTSDTYEPVATRPDPGGLWPWQRLLLNFWGGPLGGEHRRALRVRATFDGLVYLTFLQDDFLPKISEPEAQLDSYDQDQLRGVPGYAQDRLDDDSVGAFCLWECETSPLVDKLISRWQPWRPLAERRPWLRHFNTSCNELGFFEIVASDVKIERLDDPDSTEDR